MTTWIFEKLGGAAVRRDPNETQLFKTEQAEEGEYAGTDALIREILQNSMDAATGNGPVRIRLALHCVDDLPEKKRLSQYFSRLKAPLQHRDIFFDDDDVPLMEQGFLVCEDFGTRGLCGDPLLARDPQPGSTERQDFFWFWRNIGRSGKTGDDLGRWGLGKTVYRAASQVGCMFGLTVREEDGKQLLMGQAVLKIHERDGVEYVPEGYWCAKGHENTGLPLPIEDDDSLEEFRKEWKLSRKADQPGLSVVVPYITSELNGIKLLQAISVHFFLPILRGELIIDLVSIDTGEVRLDANTLEEFCNNIKWDGSRRTKRNNAPPIKFVNQCLDFQNKTVPTQILGQTKLPSLQEDAFDETVLESLRKDFADEKLVGVRVQMMLPKRIGPDELGELVVFVQRQTDGQRTDTYVVREGMTITKLNSRAGLRGIQAFVNVDKYIIETGEKNSLASLLGDSEGPAHEDWDTSEERPDQAWKNWKGRVKFCRRIVDTVVELLSPPSNKANFDLLADFFSIEQTKSPQNSRKPNSDGKGPADFGTIKPKQNWYRLDDRRGGFRVVNSSDSKVPQQAKLLISVAYDLSSGNPIKNWSSFDFDFSKSEELILKGENVKAKSIAGNKLILDINTDKFSFSAEGFDEERDLFIRIDEEFEDYTNEEETESE